MPRLSISGRTLAASARSQQYMKPSARSVMSQLTQLVISAHLQPGKRRSDGREEGSHLLRQSIFGGFLAWILLRPMKAAAVSVCCGGH